VRERLVFTFTLVAWLAGTVETSVGGFESTMDVVRYDQVVSGIVLPAISGTALNVTW
jgi:hypothetical protein